MSTKITEATLKNFQRVSTATIEPSGNIIVLAGKNAAGKTSATDGIEAALTGHNSRHIKRPIKDGNGKASIDIKLTDGATITRTYTPSGTTLRGKHADGTPFGQRELDRRISSLGIDGRRFITLGDKEQLAALLSIVDLPFVPAELEAERKQIEETRRLVGQQARAIGDVEVDPDLPTEETSASDLITKIQEGEQVNAEIDRAHNQLATLDSEIETLKARLAEAESQHTQVEQWLQTAKNVDANSLKTELEGIEEHNAQIRANNTAREQAKTKAELETQWATHTETLKALDAKKADGLAKAVMPIEGLSFDEEGVLYQGVPLSRASGREQVIVSAAMIMATNPDIRVIVIRDGNVLDMEGMEILHSMAEATDFQIFIEIVQEEKGETEYYFTEGKLE